MTIKCAIHNVVESETEDSMICTECFHVYTCWEEVVAEMQIAYPKKNEKECDQLAMDFCPLCLHDW